VIFAPKIRVFIAGPYTTPDPTANTETAIDAASTLRRASKYRIHPVIPHLSHYQALRHEESYDMWLSGTLNDVTTCHALLRLPGHSPGAEQEIELAHKFEVDVYHSMSDLLDDLDAGRWNWVAEQ